MAERFRCGPKPIDDLQYPHYFAQIILEVIAHTLRQNPEGTVPTVPSEGAPRKFPVSNEGGRLWRGAFWLGGLAAYGACGGADLGGRGGRFRAR